MRMTQYINKKGNVQVKLLKSIKIFEKIYKMKLFHHRFVKYYCI